ncbi:hypothetical protein CN376_22925 [Bacillus cereus]|uniref:hypothetical protein n=1 Tax=Bacillus cereus TaxID=1396 RepID=UPI000BF82D53|nr:hypothetical protein [Bacillus cereus]PEZ87937.1 hypothetical protein CN376_22925 [Bacillus cereus]PFR12589.1 hypothetical protein COK30_13650 [Bacillus cereus]
MESCLCVHCSGDDFHQEQMEIASKDDYMENKPPSVYEKLEELKGKLNSTMQYNLVEDVMCAVNNIDNALIGLALELPTEQAEKLLEIQERLY